MEATAPASSAGSSVASAFDASEVKTNGTRLARLLIDEGTHVLRKFLHSIYPPAKLQLVLNKNRLKLQSLKLRRLIFDSQWQKLFPPSGDPPDWKAFDISLLHFLIREIWTAPATGWQKMPADDDESLEANITRIKCFRKELCHGNSTSIPNDEFEKKWKQLSSSLEAVELYTYRRRIDRLKNDPVDHDIEHRVEEQVNQWEELDTGLVRYETEQESIKVPSCLPDELPEELMFGRSQEIQEVTEAIQSGSASIVWITGGPGFGKTTVASKAAHKLSKPRPENDRTVLFCSLRTKTTVHDAATVMTLACSKNQTKPPENPQHWLLNWSKQQVSNVTFVLDNADEVFDAADCNVFMSVLEKMRTFSRQNVSFIITSRNAHSNPNQPQVKNVRLGCLPAEEARQVLLSRIYNAKTGNELCKTDKLIELCGCVPLALCIAGSLLSEDYKEDEFIQHFEQEPSNVLGVDRRCTDQTSVEKSINSSFEVLDELEKKVLVLLCVFPGSFDSDAAKFLIADCSTNTASVSFLRELRARSFLEQVSQRRYQVHQLIQTVVQKIASDKYPELLNRGTKLVCSHFMSRLADNAYLYWSKDKCKESVEAFNEDRHNFEHFLHVYVNEIEKQGLDDVDRLLLEDFPQKCMYLEMCLLPSFYIMILEMLLKRFETENQPVHTVELLCLLGHEKRKVGNQAQYKDLMKKAKQVYARNYTEFRTNGLSQVYFFNSYAHYLSERNLPWELRNEVHEIALKLCREKLNGHPEAAATLLFVGRHRKSMPHLWEALGLFKRCLGEHFMTAQGLKAIADLYFRSFHFCNTGIELDKSFELYGEALAMMEKLGMGSHKESILTLKNIGLCHKLKGNFQEAIEFLEKAKRVADIKLEDDHKWKVMIETQLALLYDCVGRVEEAEEVMKKGLEMNQRLGQSVDKLANRSEIRLFLDRYPDTRSLFPQLHT